MTALLELDVAGEGGLEVARTARPRGPVWTDERIGVMAFLRAAGHTASAIAKTLGVTRNAVIGKLYRLGDNMAAKKPPPIERRAPISKTKLKPPKSEPPQKHIVVRAGRRGNASAEVERVELPFITDLAPDTSPNAVSLVDIGFNQCRFPLNSPADIRTFLFCGSPADGSWCERHGRVVYSKAVRE